MALTYLDLVNRVLVRLNEAPLTTDTFNTTRNIQTAVKNAVRETVDKINRWYPEWPFNATSTSVVLSPGISSYPWASNFTAVDWNSFAIQKDDTLNINTRELMRVDRDQWYMRGKERDLDNTTGIRVPTYVFESQTYGFQVSPSPDKAYTLSYDYFSRPNTLVNATDVVLIPDDFVYVIIQGAMVDMYMFKENTDATAIAKGQFNEGLADMRRIFGQQRTYIFDHRFLNTRRASWIYTGR